MGQAKVLTEAEFKNAMAVAAQRRHGERDRLALLLTHLAVSMADTNCTRWRRKTVPVWLIEKGAHAPGLVRLVCCAL
jgi:hypothetical protein